ncbi:DUF6950 family protein [Nitrosospira sp. Nsp2]|uniref:DUF6950 family protein n=1 Tax=Nitrosospira sp. Nsp2 TaxID=136548 RepID=UPI0011B247EC|nr:hypothetical protein [Nitrosospira sp. Nsp2]
MPMTLPEYITAHLTEPFKWGSHDCCTFIGAWIQIKTGRDYLTEHKPWRTARQATKKLRDLGGIRALFQGNLKEINPHMAKDGDLTIYQGTAHLFSGRHIVSVGLDGLIFTDRTVAMEAWTCHPYSLQ